MAKIREHFGITQRQLALFLGINTPQVKMTETGKRNLPESAMPLFRWLESKLAKADDPFEFSFSEEKSDFYLLMLKSKKRKLEKKVAAFYKKQSQQREAKLLVQQFHQDFPNEKETASTKAMEAIGLFAQANMETEKPGWLFEAELELIGLAAKIASLEKK